MILWNLEVLTHLKNLTQRIAEMEYCASATSILAEEIWQISEGFVEVPENPQAQFKICGIHVPKE